MHTEARYNRIGIGYDTTRRADPYLSARLHTLLDPQPHGQYLDLACGSGNYTIALAQRGVRMLGIDHSLRMLAAARAKAPTLNWYAGDATRLPFPDATFDGATCILAIHHFADYAAAFRELRRVLRRGRFVMFSATRQQMRGYWLNEYFPDALAKSILQMPDEDEVCAALAAANLSPVAREIYEIQPDLQDFFLQSGKHRPEIYLDPKVRAGISTFSFLADPAEMDAGCAKLARDIDSGRIHDVIRQYDHPHGDYLFLAAEAR